MSSILLELKTHNTRNRNKKVALATFFVLSIICVIADIFIGSQGLTFSQVIQALIHPQTSDIASKIIVWDIRMPMALMAPLIGGALALAGAQMQTTLNNPLADPYTFGVSAAAGFGASLVITNTIAIPFIPPQYQIALMAFIMCLLTTFLIAAISSVKRISIEGVMLFGIALMFAYDSLLTMMQYVASETQLQTLVFWQMGSLDRGSWAKITILAIVLPIVLLIMMKDAWQLSTLKIGHERAQAMGVNVKRLRIKTLLLVSVITSLAVSFVGAVGFVGLVAPHIARMVLGEDQRYFLPASFLVGAVLLELASIASKSIMPGIILPLTVVMSIIGIPFFVYLIIKKGGRF
ncbi:iron-siderophore ABC transporter permease [Photobacterium phosphoreum]|uniref:Iron-siderophore ABC transporter permease n=1 Tax=Photobacterium phosphoreum TaxID=659 RepID=A0A2T3JKV0_PHOPO|nr:iron ABC transporter permease [Photobacterium phosphoreum]PSU24539.1 iron-siderophore ABC transporter permease [Photobacterium phosphoreum]PSU44460.1 iron-siderophore ABC transporter permease [Photobacterium phosphoreum]PSU49588.1 iron-siderophore ABC transporter permease [Photobacterium phosphoreum]PSU72855.1 iron-siderophore ABC transporter permease [Photobacterium phosphoreum]PSU81500.1 iron-siderophore ABC transporter permease [Photobacterium phosphoreum]